MWNNFCNFYFRDFKLNDLWISVGINYCGFNFRDSIYSPRNRENKNPAKISRYTVRWKRCVNSISSQKVLFLDSLFLFWTALLVEYWCVTRQRMAEVSWSAIRERSYYLIIELGSWSPSPLIVSRDSFSLWTWARVQTARSTAYFNGCPYIFDILALYYYICLCTTFLWPLCFGWLLVLSLYKEDYLQIFKCVSFWLHGCCG